MSLTTIETPTIETPQEDQAHIDAMLKAADGLNPEPQPEEVKLYAGKYKSIEELEKGYQELQKAFSQKGQQPRLEEPKPEDAPPAKPDDPKKDDLKVPEEDEAKEALEQKGLDISVFQNEYSEKGELTADSYEALEKAGIPKDVVDAYIAGQELLAQQQSIRVFDSAGGEENYRSMLEWAKTELPEAERKAYNETIESGEMNKILMAVRGLRATYEEINGRTPNLLSGNKGGADTSTFRSRAELTAAMADPRYSKDPAYRRDVEERLGRSDIF